MFYGTEKKSGDRSEKALQNAVSDVFKNGGTEIKDAH